MNNPKSFDAFTEFRAGRYRYSETLGYGKFDYCYFEPLLDKTANCLFSYWSVPEINEKLPDGCFIPHGGHIWDWSDEVIGEDWRKKPEMFWDTYINKTRNYCQEDDNGVLITMEYSDILGRRDEKRPEELVAYPMHRSSHEIVRHMAIEVHCDFLIPMFFTKEFYEANI